ncbi:galectin-1-like [Eublepharis macularius]|uniref:Galectin n=1 Tax=Eublepharis macularius TaxID=481883 RepID=A0AA97KVJ6_EUBMA|nr:galectin-1-like [Eublepharis macularius]
MAHNLIISNLKTLHVGDSILVHGKVMPDAKIFSINLGKDASNFLIHFNPRFGEGVIVFNFMKDGKWGHPEQRAPKIPFKPGDDIKVNFTFKSNEVAVHYADGHEFDFKSQLNLSLECIEYISVDGGFQVHSIHID